MIAFPSEYYEAISAWPNCVLLETARADADNFRSYLFAEPVEVLCARQLADLPGVFEQIQKHLARSHYVAGYLNYECGYHFEPRSASTPPLLEKAPLAWFGVYARPFVFDHRSGRFDAEMPREKCATAQQEATQEPPEVSGFVLGVTEEEYCRRVEAIREYIAAGDTYQVNLTAKAFFEYSGNPAALYRTLRGRQRVSYAAFLHAGDRRILSFSPELFFRVADGRITTRPMKGTVRRGRDLAEDARLRNWLHEDPKNRSENLMIVDLLRNDIGKICQPGSVRVDELFSVETYETLFQMTSTISGALRPRMTPYELFQAIFPCGSVTGAPKCRTMQIIQQLEGIPRGVYTGAIGYFAPNGGAVFNVPIRTLVLDGERGEMGVGGGVVYDSVPREEHAECLLKARFLTQQEAPFQLLESILWDGQYQMLQGHLNRLAASARYFGYLMEEADVLAALSKNAENLQPGHAYKVRLLVESEGDIVVENVPIEPPPANETAMLAPEPTCSEDRFLYHKTTRRALYERWFAEAHRRGHADALFRNEKGEMTEGATSNLFVAIGGRMLTPPVACGLLPGVFRRTLLEQDASAGERVLTLEDLRRADAIYLCNSVRGLRRVRLVETEKDAAASESHAGMAPSR